MQLFKSEFVQETIQPDHDLDFDAEVYGTRYGHHVSPRLACGSSVVALCGKQAVIDAESRTEVIDPDGCYRSAA